MKEFTAIIYNTKLGVQFGRKTRTLAWDALDAFAKFCKLTAALEKRHEGTFDFIIQEENE